MDFTGYILLFMMASTLNKDVEIDLTSKLGNTELTREINKSWSKGQGLVTVGKHYSLHT